MSIEYIRLLLGNADVAQLSMVELSVLFVLGVSVSHSQARFITISRPSMIGKVDRATQINRPRTKHLAPRMQVCMAERFLV